MSIGTRPLLCLSGFLILGVRERITLEIEKMGERFKKNGATRAWLDDCKDELVRGVVCEVNGPLFDWVVNRLGSSHFTAHELFCRGSPLTGCIAASGGGQPIDATSMGDVWSLWNDRERDNLELIDSLKDDDLENELHDLALRDASLRRMSPPMPVCQEDIRNRKLHPRFGVGQGVKSDGSVKVSNHRIVLQAHVSDLHRFRCEL